MSDIPTSDDQIDGAPVVASAPIPDTIEPPPAGYGDKLIQARLAGHPWDAVDRFVNGGWNEATRQGYTDNDIRQHLGMAPSEQPTFRASVNVQNRLSWDDQFKNAVKENSSVGLMVTPLEEPSADRIASYAGTDKKPPVAMPDHDFVEPLPSGLNLHDEFARQSYARSLLGDEVRSPRDFAERYTGAILGAGTGADPGSLVRATGELADSLPSDREFTDQAIAIAHSSGLALSPEGVATVRNNLIDHWSMTGQPLQDTYKQAYNDPEFAANLTTEKVPEPDAVARFLALPLAIGEFWKGAGIGLTSGADELKAKVDSGEISSLPEALGATIGHIPEGMIEGMWHTAKRAGEALMGGDPLTPEEAVNAAALGIGGSIVEGRPLAKVLDPEAASGHWFQNLPGPEVFGEKAQAIKDTLWNAAGKLGDIAGDLKDKFYTHVAAQLGDEIHVGDVPPGTAPLTVWHASPHDFDRFDNSKIGTGEGNLGHGQGMYFAENPKVHEYYKEQFSNTEMEGFDAGKLSENGRAALAANHNGDIRGYFDDLVNTRDDIIDHGLDVNEAMSADDLHDLGYLEGLTKPGNSYKVALHVDPDKLFELDKPIGEQGEHVEQAVAKLAEEHGVGPTTNVEDGAKIPWGNLTGREFYDDLKFKLGGEAEASQALQKAGFDGTKYLDGESRRLAPKLDEIKQNLAKSEGYLADPETPKISREIHEALAADYKDQLAKAANPTHNYVIFDDAKLNILEKNGTPVTPADVAQQVDRVAHGQQTARAVAEYLKGTFGDLMGDESGALKLWNTTAGKQAADLFRQTREEMQNTIIKREGQGDRLKTVARNMIDPNSPLKTVAQRLDNAYKLIQPHMKEWEGEFAKGINGNPMDTFIGNLHDYMSGRSMGVALRHDSTLGPVADIMRNVSQFMEAYLKQATQDGAINLKSYYEDFFPQNWRDPNAALKFVQETAGTSKLGTSGHLQQRQLTFADAVARGLQPVDMNPITSMLRYVDGTVNYVQSRYMLKDLENKGLMYWDTAPRDFAHDIKLEGPGLQRAVAQGVMQYAFANRGGARAWNQWVGRAVYGDNVGNGIYEKLLFAKNAATQLALINPTFHGIGIVWETGSSGIGKAISEFARLEPGRGAKDLAMSSAILPKAAETYARGLTAMQRYASGHPDPIVQLGAEAGMRMVKGRPIEYAASRAPGYLETMAHEGLIQNYKDRLQHVIEADPHGDVSLAQTAWRATEFAGAEFGRMAHVTSAAIMDDIIPTLKAGTFYERMGDVLRQNPGMPRDKLLEKAREIRSDVDNRLGEMNMNTVFWPMWVKKAAALTMISPTWLYGFLRFAGQGLGSVANIATLGKVGKFNETALVNMLAYGAVTLGGNMLYQYAKTGTWPWSNGNSLYDAYIPKTGGKIPKTGDPERFQMPGLSKEVHDLQRIGETTYANPWHFGEAMAHYALSRGGAPFQLGRAFLTGEDAIGHHVTAGDHFPNFVAKLFTPIFMSTMEDRKIGTGVSKLENYLGGRPAGPAVTNPSRFIQGEQARDRKNQIADYKRQVRENRYLETPKPLPSLPGAMGTRTQPTPDQLPMPRY